MKAEICQQTGSCNTKLNPLLQLFTRHLHDNCHCKNITYVSLRMETGAKASPTLRDATDLDAAGVLMEVKADAVAAMERTARESFIVSCW